MRGFASLILMLLEAIATGAVLGFLFWALACLTRGFAEAKFSRVPKFSVLTLSALRDRSHPVHAYSRGFVQALVGLVVAFSVCTLMAPYVPGVP